MSSKQSHSITCFPWSQLPERLGYVHPEWNSACIQTLNTQAIFARRFCLLRVMKDLPWDDWWRKHKMWCSIPGQRQHIFFMHHVKTSLFCICKAWLIHVLIRAMSSIYPSMCTCTEEALWCTKKYALQNLWTPCICIHGIPQGCNQNIHWVSSKHSLNAYGTYNHVTHT